MSLNKKSLKFLLTVLFLFSSVLTAQDTELYSARRKALLEKLTRAAALLPAAWEEELDTYRQANNFYYLTGIEQPELLLLLSPEARRPETLYLPARNLSEGSLSEAWVGKKLGPGKQTEEQTGIAAAVDRNIFPRTIAGLAGSIDRLYFDFKPSPLDGPVSAAEVMLKEIRERYPHLEILPLSALIDSMRIVKDPVEISLLEKAIGITGRSLEETIRAIRPGMFEYQVEALIEYGFHKRGSQRPGFPSIVGGGPNSTVLHYNSNLRRIEDGDLVLMDVGAESDYYTADITRTVPANGKFSARQREIYELVLKAQAEAIAAVKPGVTLLQVHKTAMKVIEDAGYKDYFIHYVGHFLGMDVHDVGSRELALEPGMVITIEPGIYLSKEALGIRIEDDVLVTPGGCRVLSESIPKSIESIESLMAGK
jgi:Xaa-Pro aminopeptidase